MPPEVAVNLDAARAAARAARETASKRKAARQTNHLNVTAAAETRAPPAWRVAQIIHRDTEPVATTAARVSAENEPSTEAHTSIACTGCVVADCAARPLSAIYADLLLRTSKIYVTLFSGDRCILDYVCLKDHSHWLIYNKMYFSRGAF